MKTLQLSSDILRQLLDNTTDNQQKTLIRNTRTQIGDIISDVKDELRLFCHISPLKAYDSNEAQAYKTSVRFMMAMGLQAVEKALGNHGPMRVFPGPQGAVVPIFMKSAPIATNVRDALVAVADGLNAGLGKVDIILSALTVQALVGLN